MAVATVTGLTPGTTYHFRVVAHNEIGTAEGTDETFTTAAAFVLGNPPASICKTGFVHRGGKCVKKRKRKHHHHHIVRSNGRG